MDQRGFTQIESLKINNEATMNQETRSTRANPCLGSRRYCPANHGHG